jgi:hypothetical protein
VKFAQTQVLPERDIETPASPWRVLGPRLAIPTAFAILIFVPVVRDTKGVEAALGTLGIFILIVAIELPLLLRKQRRRQDERMRNLAPGSIYAGPAGITLPGGRREVQGDLLIDSQGVTFTPTKAGGPQINILWPSISSVTLRPARSRPLSGALMLSKNDGTTDSFIVRGYEQLAAALSSPR